MGNPTIRLKRATAARWTAVNPVLLAAEPGYESDTGNLKVGDGTTAWTGLPYIGSGTAPASPLSFVRKAADTTLNNTATLTNDPELSIPMVSGAVYEVQAFLVYSASTTADISIGFAYPAGSGIDWTPDSLSGSVTSAGGVINRPRANQVGTGQLGGAGVGTRCVARPTGIVTAGSAGNLILKWAQSVAEVSDAVVHAPSMMKLTRIA